MPSPPIERIDPTQARERQLRGVRLVDVREDNERLTGQAEGAIGIPRTALLADAARHLPSPADEVLLICQAGTRSFECAQALHAAGYTRVASVDGGTTAWRARGLPMVVPEGDADFAERYARHLRLPEIGVEGQQRLERARVLLVGAGGLGSPIAYYLAAAGVGHLRIADADVVDRSNLQRQILHAEDRIGTPKVESARRTLEGLNPRVRIESVQVRVDAGNAAALLEDCAVAIDGADNFEVRYVLNDACMAHRIPLVHGAVHRFEGQASVFDAGRQPGVAPCYRCLFPEPPPREFAPNCSEAGVLGVLPGLVGMVQATEVLKLLLGIGTPLVGRLLHIDALSMSTRGTRLAPDPQCPTCTRLRRTAA